VVDGSNLAEKSGKEMTATRDKSYELVKLVQKIAERSEAQAKVALNLQEQATKIKKSNTQTFEQMTEQTVQTENLVDYATELQKVISAFKILKPDQNQGEKVVNS
jgi:methyl-accepting chemotaxis protein